MDLSFDVIMSSEETIPQDENLRLAELLFKAQHGSESAGSELKAVLIERKALPFIQRARSLLVRPILAESSFW